MNEMAGNVLKTNRERVGLSQRKLAALVGCDNSKIVKLEKGTQTMTPEWAKRLAGPLGIEPHELLPGILGKEAEADLRARRLTEKSFQKLESFYKYLLAEQEQEAREKK